MKRLHVHVSVDDLTQSIRFYSTLFAAEPTVVKGDYAKWMLEDPRVNFAISERQGRVAGISHLGIQTEDQEELTEVYGRLSRAERPTVEAKGTTCCYANSDKRWIADPQGVPWETFFTYGQATVYGEGSLDKLREATDRAVCCEPVLRNRWQSRLRRTLAAPLPAARCRAGRVAEKVYNVLFLCTGNSARSIIAEALLEHWGKGRFNAYSAGSFPKGTVHRLALDLLEKARLDTGGLRNKSWNEFAKPGAPETDFVFTVCDQAAREVCPVWPSNPVSAHWGVPDPASIEGTEAEQRRAFCEAYVTLENRIKLFTALPIDKLDRLAIKRSIDEIGREGAAPRQELS